MDFCFTFSKLFVFWTDLTKHIHIFEKRLSVCVLPTSYDCLKINKSEYIYVFNMDKFLLTVIVYRQNV